MDVTQGTEVPGFGFRGWAEFREAERLTGFLSVTHALSVFRKRVNTPRGSRVYILVGLSYS